jgi:hypothetical protein
LEGIRGPYQPLNPYRVIIRYSGGLVNPCGKTCGKLRDFFHRVVENFMGVCEVFIQSLDKSAHRRLR